MTDRRGAIGHPRPRRRARVPTVLGVGNVLLGDEGLGVRAVELLRPRAPRGVRVLEAGALGLEALTAVEDASHLLVLDCIDAGRPAGELLRLDGADLRGAAAPRLSPHELGLEDLLSLAALRERSPEEVVVMGIQPARIAPGVGLSPEVEASLPMLVEASVAVLETWVSRTGHRPRGAGVV